MSRLLLPLVALFVAATMVHGAVLFEDNFDSSPDWQSNQTVSKTVGGTDIAVVDDPSDGCSDNNPDVMGSYCPPKGWHGYYAAASHWSDRGEDTYVLSSEGAYGGSGKGMTLNHESWGYWSGGRLLIWLGESGYEELYVRMRVKYDDGWSWSDGTGHSMQKLTRISSFWGDAYTESSPNIYQFQVAGLNESVFYPDWYYNLSFDSFSFLATSYIAPDYTVSSSTTYYGYEGPMTDGQWHTVEYRVKMNSAAGVADGEWEFFIDGVSAESETNIPWRDTGSSTAYGWNTVMPLDNMYTSNATEFEQKMFMDDIVVSTSYVGPDYVIGDATPTTTYYYDPDADGYGDDTNQSSATDPGTDWYTAAELTATSGDCDNTSSLYNPSQAHVCLDGRYQDTCGACGQQTGGNLLRVGVTPLRSVQ